MSKNEAINMGPHLAINLRVCMFYRQYFSCLQRMYRSSHIRQLEDGGRRLKQRIVDLEKEVMLLEFKKNMAKAEPEVTIGKSNINLA